MKGLRVGPHQAEQIWKFLHQRRRLRLHDQTVLGAFQAIIGAHECAYVVGGCGLRQNYVGGDISLAALLVTREIYSPERLSF